MVCIYCGNKTQVTNSRLQKRLNRTWRRRECTSCHAVFTTEEAAQLGTSLVVQSSHGHTRPFSRDTLFVSILQAVGHRKASVEDAGALTATIIADLVHDAETAAVTPRDIINSTLQVLRRFDAAAAVQYAAYHQG